MTAASYTTRPFLPLARTSFRWTRFFALLGVCLPVPICAVSGLSIPLPAIVERIAVSLVPWADGVAMSANEPLHTGTGGSIVTGADERSADEVARLAGVVTTDGTRTKDGGRLVFPFPGGRVTTGPGSLTPAAPDRGPAAPDQGAGGAQPAGSGDQAPSAPSAPGESPMPEPGPSPTTPTEPAPPPVQSNPDPLAPVKPVVEDVLEPVTPIVEDTTKTVEEILPPLPPLPPILPGLGK